MFDVSEIVTKLQPSLLSLESHRLGFRQQLKTQLSAVGGSVLILVCLSLLIKILFATVFIVAAGGIAAGIIFYKYNKSKNEYANNYKSSVIPPLVNEINPSLKFDADSGIDRSSFSNSELYRSSIDRYKTEDLIAGSYGKTQLRLAEIHAESEHEDADGNKSHDTIFQGVLLIADFNKNFKGRTFVMPDLAESMLGGIGRNLQKLTGRRGTDLVQLENPEFEKRFAVHSSDQVEARYILSSSMVQRILDLVQRFDNNKIRIAFKDSAVFIAVPSKRKFLEPSVDTPATNPEQITKMLNEIQDILEIIEELNLNTRIWSKD